MNPIMRIESPTVKWPARVPKVGRGVAEDLEGT